MVPMPPSPYSELGTKSVKHQGVQFYLAGIQGGVFYIMEHNHGDYGMSPTDAHLLERWARQGDADAFKTLAERYADLVYSVSRRILGDAADAEDNAQECFEALALAGLKPRTYVGAWLHRVATNKALNRRRQAIHRRRRERQFSEDVALGREVVWDDIHDLVDEAIAGLPDHLRLPIVAHFLEGESHDAIARTLGVSRQTITYRVEKGIEKIRKTLGRRGIQIPAITLIAIAKANVSEAAPATLLPVIGKIALAGPGIAALSFTGWLSGFLAVKTAVVLAAVGLCAVGGFWSIRTSISSPESQEKAVPPPTRETAENIQPVSESVPPDVPPSAATEKKVELTIEGTVWHDQTHSKPVAGALVTARNCRNPFNQTTARTDAEGRFILQARAPEASYALLAEDGATGRVSQESLQIEVGRVESVKNVEITLGPGGSISGHVIGESLMYDGSWMAAIRDTFSFMNRARGDLERRKERPLAGVEVTLTGTGYIPIERTVATDAKGGYLFGSLLPGAYKITPKRPREAIVDDKEVFLSAELKDSDMRAKDVDFRFRVDGLSITGHVSDAQGRPLAGAEIIVSTLCESEPGAGGAVTTGTARTLCDDAGNYRVDSLRPMDLEDTQTFMSYGLAGVTHRVHAQIKGYAAAEMTVPGITQDLAKTAEAIRFTAAQLGIEQGKNQRPGELPEVRGSVISGVDFILNTGVEVSGTLVTTQGTVLANHWIGIEPSSPDEHVTADMKTENFSHSTDVSGKFSFEGLPEGTYTFLTYIPGQRESLYAQNKPLTLAAGDKVSDYVVTVEGPEARGEIKGRVLDERTKTPLGKFTINVLDFEELAAGSGGQKGEVVQSDPANGQFVVRGVSAGRVSLQAVAEGYAPATQQVDVQSGASTDVVMLMRRGGDIEGNVTLNGEAFHMAVVNVYAEGAASRLQEAITDEAGHFSLKDLPEGRFRVVASAIRPEWERTSRNASQWVSVEPEGVSRADFAFTGTAILSGVFSFPATQQAGVIAVRETKWRGTPLPINEWSALGDSALAWAFLEKSGEYRLEALPAGDYVVTCATYNSSNGGSGEKVDIRESSYDVHIESGQSTTLNLEIP
jgi:RNA polymerase sigma-70 factor (ECF subfamily)